MKKRVVSMVLALVMLCNLTVSAWAEDPIVASGQCGDSDTESRIQWLLWNTGKLEISGEGHMEHYSRNRVPWKKYKEQITEVVIYGPQDELKSCVLSIGNYAFYGCANLTTVTIPETVAVIGSYAFSGCKSLKEITLPDSVGRIGDWAFAESGIKSICLPKELTSIGDGVFSYCENLANVTFSSKLTSIGLRAFSETGLTRVAIPSTVTEIERDAFLSCEKLEYVWLPYGLEKISGRLFGYCSSLKGVEIPPTVRTISYSAFQDCSSLESIIIPPGVETIENGAFARCESMTEITIPDSVKTIMTAAFIQCKSLTEITIPVGVTEIGGRVFMECDNLQAVYVAEDNPAFQSVDGALMSKDGTTLYYYPGKKEESYEIPEGVTTLQQDAIYGCPNLKTIVFPSTLKTAYSMAIEACPKLTSCFFRGPGMEDFNNLGAYGATFYYIEGQPGWTSPTCCGHQTALWDGGSLIPGTLLDGDINGDSKVDATDLQQLYGYLTGQVTLGMAQKMAADYNGDGVVDVYDLQALYEHLALQGTAQ